jgi:hypothetical protein
VIIAGDSSGNISLSTALVAGDISLSYLISTLTSQVTALTNSLSVHMSASGATAHPA